MTLRRRLLAISLAALGCESIAPRTTPDAAVDAGAVVDVSDAPASDIVDASMVDAPDVQTPDAPDVRTVDIVDAPVADASDVVTEDIVDATLVDAPDVVTEDIVDATVLDTLDAVSPDVVDASAADTADRVTSDSVDASVNPFPSTGADGPFPGTRVAAGGVISLEPRVWHFTTINVPPGVTVRAALGSAVLELRATGDVVIEGAINLSGGNGLSGFMGYLMRGGGDTGTPTNSSTAGRGGLGSPAPTPAGCLSGGNLGGGCVLY